MNNLKLKLKKLIGKYIGYWCEYCGEPVEDYGYNFKTRCSDPDCLSHPKDPKARKRFNTKDLNKIMDKPKKRGRPRKDANAIKKD